MPRLTAIETAKRLDLYDQGLSDFEIAAALGNTPLRIGRWRCGRGLPSNASPFIPQQMADRCKALLRRGVSAPLIARETGLNIKTLEKWRGQMLRDQPDLRRAHTSARGAARMSNGLRYYPLPQPERSQAILLYADGLNDAQIAAAIGSSRTQVFSWRRALYLPALGHGRPRKTKTAANSRPPRLPVVERITPMSNLTHAAIVASLAKWAAPDLRDDMASEMWLALLEGEISVSQIPESAGRICNEVARDFADRFGPRSLDEDLSNGEGFKLLDMIRDDRSSSWLEEMGATVW